MHAFMSIPLFTRVFVEFERQRLVDPLPTDVAQPVQEAVYVALKKRHERNKFFLNIKDDKKSQSAEMHRDRESGARGAQMGGSVGISSGVVKSIPSIDLPDLGTQQIMITEVCVAIKI